MSEIEPTPPPPDFTPETLAAIPVPVAAGGGIVARFFGRILGLAAYSAVGTAAGVATAGALEPSLQRRKNVRWAGVASGGGAIDGKPLAPGEAAEAVAEGAWPYAAAVGEAYYNGLSDFRFKVMVELAKAGPDLATAMSAWRRGELSPDGFDKALKKAKIHEEFWPAIKALKQARLSPAEIANAIVQGYLPNPGIVSDPTGGGTNPDMVTGIDPIKEAEAWGYDAARLQALAGPVGLPPAADMMLELLRRGIVTEDEVVQALKEGHTKNRWIPAILKRRRNVLSHTTYAGLRLRGWINAGQAAAGGALTGYTPEDMELEYLNRGRPIAPVQFQQAYARNAAPEGVGLGYDDFEKAIKQSDIRPEWAGAIWAATRHVYPSLFQLRQAVKSGAISPERARVILGYERYESQDADSMIKAWTKGGDGAAAKEATAADVTALYEGKYWTRASAIAGLKDLGYSDKDAERKLGAIDARRVSAARGQSANGLHAAYVKGKITSAAVTGALGALGYTDRQVAGIAHAWTIERNAVYKPPATGGGAPADTGTDAIASGDQWPGGFLSDGGESVPVPQPPEQ